MTQRTSELLTAALSLSPAERQELADRLWESLEPFDAHADMTEVEFAAELERRHREFQNDPSVGVPWEEVKRMTLGE